MAGDGEEEPTVMDKGGGDKLILRGMQFHGFHGVKHEEKKLGQKFVIDVDAWMDLAAAGESDNISQTVSYTDIYRIAKGIVEGPPHNLLESVAQSIANSHAAQVPSDLLRSSEGREASCRRARCCRLLGSGDTEVQKNMSTSLHMRKPKQRSLRILVELIYVLCINVALIALFLWVLLLEVAQ